MVDSCKFFFYKTNTLIVLDDRAASKAVKGRTSRLVQLGGWSAAGEHDGRVSSGSARLHLIFSIFLFFSVFFDILILTKTHKN